MHVNIIAYFSVICVGFNMNAIVNVYTNNLMYSDEVGKELVHEKKNCVIKFEKNPSLSIYY